MIGVSGMASALLWGRKGPRFSILVLNLVGANGELLGR